MLCHRTVQNNFLHRQRPLVLKDVIQVFDSPTQQLLIDIERERDIEEEKRGKEGDGETERNTKYNTVLYKLFCIDTLYAQLYTY